MDWMPCQPAADVMSEAVAGRQSIKNDAVNWADRGRRGRAMYGSQNGWCWTESWWVLVNQRLPLGDTRGWVPTSNRRANCYGHPAQA
jgi:hypothetical protein